MTEQQLCVCCHEPIEVIGKMMIDGEGIAEAGHCINELCPLEKVTERLENLPLITEAQMLDYAKAKIWRLTNDLKYTRSKLPAPRMLG